MHVLITTTPFGGHQPPLVGLGRELVARGHRLTYYTGRKFSSAAEGCGARWLPWRQAQDFDDLNPRATFPHMREGDGLAAVMDSFDELYFRTGPGQLADVTALHQQDPVDVVIGESLCVAAPLLHETTGVPWVGFSLSPLALSSRYLPPGGLGLLPGRGRLGRVRDAALRRAVDRTLAARMAARLNIARTRVGLPPTPLTGLDSLYLGQVLLAQGVPALEFPRPDAPAALHLIGDAAHGTRTAVETPAWLNDLDPDRPVVHVTAGTLDVTGDLCRRVVHALTDSDVQVVVGGDPGRVPATPNVIAPGWVPYDLLLPRCSVVVTNGGYGGVLSALAAAVPVVVAPAGRDKPEVATRVAYSGAGINLRRRDPHPGRLRAAVQTCLTDPRYRQAAGHVAAQFVDAGGAARAADLVENLLRGAA